MHEKDFDAPTPANRGMGFAILLALLAVLFATAGLLFSGEAQAGLSLKASSVPGTLAWREVAPVTDKYLRDVHMVSSNDGWIVGNDGVVLRYNGVQWSVYPTFTEEILVDVHMISANEGYILGWGAPDTGGNVYRWNGTQWTFFYATPTDPNRIDDIGSNNLWVAGLQAVYRYDGVQWTTSFTTTANVFSVQVYDTGSGPGGWAVGANRFMAEYENGTWTVLNPSPAPQTLYNNFFTSPTDGWAVGYTATTYILHWDGVQWTLPYTTTYPLDKIHMVSASEGFATGDGGDIARFDGTGWSPVYVASTGLTNLYMVSATDGWAVGYEGLMVHYSDDSTPTPTTTPVPPTSTSTATSVATSTSVASATSPPSTPTSPAATATTAPATATSIPTATACPLQFTDVPSGSTFYDFVRCLACRGLVGGYADGTFRPNTDITRGQIAKIVSNAAGYNDTPAGQTFEDVPADQTFYVWIERLSNRGHMGGYNCGGPGEPCGSGSKPYFRPNSNATRGQLSKIVANAAGLGGTFTEETYADVPVSNAFYQWIMRLSEIGAIGGYRCGGPGELCDPQERPYFRPFNNVTRGQASKIVASTFFPGCQTPER